MKLFKIAALVAIASLPLLLFKKKKEVPEEGSDYEGIFEEELSGD